MDRFEEKINSIENLKQKLSIFKQTLETAQSGNVANDYLSMKFEHQSITGQMLKIEEKLRKAVEQYNSQTKELMENVKTLSEKMNKMDHTITDLQKCMETLVNKDQDEVIRGIKEVIKNEIGKQLMDSSTVDQIKEELSELKVIINSNKVNKNEILHPNSYQQLRNIIHTSISSKNLYPKVPELISNDIANFYHGVSKKTQKASFLPPTGPKRIELRNKYKDEAKDVSKNKALGNSIVASEHTNNLTFKPTSNMNNDSSIQEIQQQKELGGREESNPSVHRGKDLEKK
ncbi:hypothetical protein [Metabacillus niabensis]|uniref:hypothetical protein n=1 Tax=Metabacillus niabensis TaxID=324854 RepID=UPI001CFAEE80|nr:hypothetical protein [Metabacillus niabensis]